MPSAYRALPGRERELNKSAGALFAPRLVNQPRVIPSLTGMKFRRYTAKLEWQRPNNPLKPTLASPDLARRCNAKT
jgi:hypothetical protein